ncbi:hypothetical protein GZL_00271 [Streptomyces sp. 769]|nr:hypothetical protein GZL_00271 [Streptomyces sp. 769]
MSASSPCIRNASGARNAHCAYPTHRERSTTTFTPTSTGSGSCRPSSQRHSGAQRGRIRPLPTPAKCEGVHRARRVPMARVDDRG